MTIFATKIRVVIVDDHTLFREGLCLILRDFQGLEIVGEAANGIQAVEVISDLQPDIVLLDITMPQLNGFELLPIIKQKSPATKTLIVSGAMNEDSIIQAIEAGAKGYLSKDASVSCLFNAIMVVANGELWVERRLIAKYFNGQVATMSGRKESLEKTENLLTPREQEVLLLLTKGSTNKEIGQKLFISEKTVKSHLSRIFKKLNVNKRLEAILCAMKQGLC
jgi:DNA-binding NarL/FixJ family response regulator